MVMKTYYVTVEAVVSRVEYITAPNVDEAMAQAKKEFIAKTGAVEAFVVETHEEPSI
tara:strand:- start:299 stop:469 length:171 start_codon:yes stop_codon:yes gene_type:complete